MIDRLTARSPRDRQAYLVKVKSNEQQIDGHFNTLVCIKESFERLADYEETELTPYGISGIKADNAKLKLQVEKVLEAISAGVPCPSAADLPNRENCDWKFDCRECWREALDTVAVVTEQDQESIEKAELREAREIEPSGIFKV